LVYKKYLTEKLSDLKHEFLALNLYLKHHSSFDSFQRILDNIPEAQHILSKYFTPESEELSNWMHSPYERNTNHPENLLHKGLSGNLLRSKSEAMIDIALTTNKIPFRYEETLNLGDTTIYPDFTILHPKTGKIYYWEHFGLMDNPPYIKNFHLKLQTYVSAGIIPSIDLIITCETLDKPLGIDDIEKTITHYFL